jgi:SAM-dependent methyltransferase
VLAVDDPGHRWVGSMPEAYERWLVPAVFHPFAVDLARRVAARGPRTVLELAAGTGVLTRELVAALGPDVVTATDLNGAMVDVGRRQVPGATWQQADASAVPFDDGRFDLVACQFGVMFLPDKPAAFAEVRRVLAPGGVFLMNAWSTLDTHGFEAALVAGLRRMFPDDPPTFLESVPHGYPDLDVVVADLQAGGLRCTVAEAVTVEGHAASATDLARGYCLGTPLRAEIAARGDLGAAVTAVADELAARLGDGPLTAPMTAHVVEAVR